MSDETGVSIETSQAVSTLTAGSLTVTAVPELEQAEGLGFLAAVNVITGCCVELTACHAEVAPDRWRALNLAITCGLGPPVSVAIEMIGAPPHV